jgi:hypothetical protein
MSTEPRICKLVPFNLYAAEKPIRAVVFPDGRLEKYVMVHEIPPSIAYICELVTNN